MKRYLKINQYYENVLSVIIPVFNEQDTIIPIIQKVINRPETNEIIVINDASNDNTYYLIESFVMNSSQNITVINNKSNKGKGASIRAAIPSISSPYTIIQDADFEYEPDDYPILLSPLIANKADVVYGSRFLNLNYKFNSVKHEIGNRVLTFFSNLFTGIQLSDMETCYKVFKTEIIKNLNLDSDRFGIEVELTSKLAWAKILKIQEVPIRYYPRKHDEGKKITWKDGMASLYHILKYNVFSNKESFYKKQWDDVIAKSF